MLTDLLTRRNLLKCITGLFCESLLLAGEVPTWLKSVTRSPDEVPEPKRKLLPLLIDATGEQINNVEQWEKRAAELRFEWRQLLKPLNRDKRPANEFEIISRETVGNVIRERLLIWSKKGFVSPRTCSHQSIRSQVENVRESWRCIPQPQKPSSRLPDCRVRSISRAEYILPRQGLSFFVLRIFFGRTPLVTSRRSLSFKHATPARSA